MVFDEKVLTALEVLTDAAENDFELYRICNLVRDLTSPPKVEQIDDTHQKFNDMVYIKSENGHYRRNQYIHLAVWNYFTGVVVPQGCLIHHKDWNSANNDFSNLQMVTKQQHQNIHFKGGHPNPTKEKYFCEYCGKEYYRANKGHNRFCSANCRNHWHRENDKVIKNCVVCGKEFESVKQDKVSVCSAKCAGIWITSRESFEKICPCCKKIFHSRVKHQIYCSKQCYRAELLKRREKIINSKVCPVCGKVFPVTPKHPDVEFCSRSCSMKANWQKRKSNFIDNSSLKDAEPDIGQKNSHS